MWRRKKEAEGTMPKEPSILRRAVYMPEVHIWNQAATDTGASLKVVAEPDGTIFESDTGNVPLPSQMLGLEISTRDKDHQSEFTRRMVELKGMVDAVL